MTEKTDKKVFLWPTIYVETLKTRLIEIFGQPKEFDEYRWRMELKSIDPMNVKHVLERATELWDVFPTSSQFGKGYRKVCLWNNPEGYKAYLEFVSYYKKCFGIEPRKDSNFDFMKR